VIHRSWSHPASMTVAWRFPITSTHGAFGAIAFASAPAMCVDVLAAQSLSIDKLKVRRICGGSRLPFGVYAKELIHPHDPPARGQRWRGYCHDFAGPAHRTLSMEERMTPSCKHAMSGARCGYVQFPIATTFAIPARQAAWLRGRANWRRAVLVGKAWPAGRGPLRRRRLRFRCLGPGAHGHSGDHPRPGDRHRLRPCRPRGSSNPTSAPWPKQGLPLHGPVTRGLRWPVYLGCLLHRQLHQRSVQ